MPAELPVAGSAGPEVARLAQEAWSEAAARAGVDLTELDAGAPVGARLAWAERVGLVPGTILSRYSSQLQHSTTDQVRECVEFAARNRIYIPAEFVCCDEAVSGRKSHRDGLERVQFILAQKLARVLLVFKVSRLFRVAYRGFSFFQECVVEKGLRAVSVSQGIDTADAKIWKPLAYFHGVMDELLVTSIADHVRAGLKGLFLQGYVTGALPVGYRAVELPGGRPTNRGRPRTVPQIDEEVAQLIRQHFEWIRDGMPLAEGWRRWVAAGGPCDPRATTGVMKPYAYRRMLANQRYTGRWAFGRKRNLWRSGLDTTIQELQPETEVAVYQCDELRIVDEALFHAVQQRLASLKAGPRGPKKKAPKHLWDLVTDLFVCSRCGVRYHVTGANGGAMRCKNGPLCPCQVMVRRRDAVVALSQALAGLLRQDGDLVDQVIGRAAQIASAGDETTRDALSHVERALTAVSRKIDDLTELAGQGSDEDRAALRAKVRAALAERADHRAEHARLQRVLAASTTPITPERVRVLLNDLTGLLDDAAAGLLGPDVVYRAADVFRKLVGGRVVVHVETRAGRKRANVRGTFRPDLIRTARAALDMAPPPDAPVPPEVQVWLRKPPKKDQLAERVHQLIDIDGLSYREAATVLQGEGQTGNSGVVWQIYHRYYEMIGQPVPDRPYNNGRPRRVASSR
jgi:DNA invertase Pin-like site-specific DNA recombinase